MINIFVANLPFRITSEELEILFTPFGDVQRAHVATDRDTGQSRGFGFVEMQHDKEALHAIQELDRTEIDGRRITVNITKPRQQVSWEAEQQGS